MAPNPETTAVITVAEALQLPALQRGLPEVLCAAGGLDRSIRWVHAGEVPNIASLLSGGELLLTTGMGFDGGEADRKRFIAGLAQRGVAALVIELGYSFDEIPASMCAAAEAAGLPLIVLHREVPFVAVTEEIHTELINRQYGLLRDGEAIKERLIAVMLEGDGLPELLATLSQTVGNPVFLESAAGQLLYHAGRGDDLDAWDSARSARGSAVVQAPVPMGSDSQPGRLVILPTRRRPTELDQIALRHAAGIVALALLRAREEDELLVRERGNLLTELAAGAVSGAEAARQAQRMGFAPQTRRMLAVAIDEAPPSGSPARAALLADLQRELEGRGTALLCGAHRGDGPLLALVAVAVATGGAAHKHRATAALLADQVARVWGRRRPGTETVVAVDGPVAWPDAGRALRAATDAAACAATLPPQPWFDARDLELERLLWSVGAGAGLEEFVRRTLGPLLDHDRERKLTLVGTLQALCAHGGHKAQAARDLHLHRQALYHRIARIEELLSVDLSDPARLATLHVALRALPYTDQGASHS